MEALAQQLEQPPETVTRNSRVDIVSGGIDEIDPPEALDEFAEQARTTGPVRKNLRQWCNDVVEPGYRVTADSEVTEDFFMGGDAAPTEAPDGGFLENAAIFAGERETDYYDFLKETVWQRWVRGTILVELLKNDRDDPESEITGFYHIRPETVYPQCSTTRTSYSRRTKRTYRRTSARVTTRQRRVVRWRRISSLTTGVSWASGGKASALIRQKSR